MTTKPHAATIIKWLRDNDQSLGCLTGGSSKALLAAVQIIGAYSYCDSEAEPLLLSAFRSVVMTMPPNQRHLAYHSIAHVLNWSDREKLWTRAELPPLEHVGRCKYE